MVRVVQLEVRLKTLQCLLLFRLLRHLHHFSLSVLSAMCQVLRIVPARVRIAPQNDNVLLVRLDRDVYLISVHLWVDDLKAFELGFHFFFKCVR